LKDALLAFIHRGLSVSRQCFLRILGAVRVLSTAGGSRRMRAAAAKFVRHADGMARGTSRESGMTPFRPRAHQAPERRPRAGPFAFSVVPDKACRRPTPPPSIAWANSGPISDQTNEQEGTHRSGHPHEFITPALAGPDGDKWNVITQLREEVYFTKGRVIVRGKTIRRGEAKKVDYILFYKPGIPIAVVEAKDNNHAVGAGMQQAIRYGEVLDVPFR
jgi:hypothetical protein